MHVRLMDNSRRTFLLLAGTWTRIAIRRMKEKDENLSARAKNMASSDKWFPEGYTPNISTERWLELPSREKLVEQS